MKELEDDAEIRLQLKQYQAQKIWSASGTTDFVVCTKIVFSVQTSDQHMQQSSKIG